MIVLDTHTAIWYATGAKLARRARVLIESEAKRGGVILSAISAWEIGMLAHKDRLGFLAADVGSYIGELFSMDGVNEQPVTVKIAELAARLPGFHGDPADRIIVATAVERSATLVTRDARINAYAKATTFVNALRC